VGAYVAAARGLVVGSGTGQHEVGVVDGGGVVDSGGCGG